MGIVIQPVLTGLDDNTLNKLTEDIRTELEHLKLTVTNVAHNPAIIQFNRDMAFESAFDNYERMVKECVHELGHIFGFNHCPDMLCVMHFSNSLSDTDFKGKSFCSTCRIKKPIF